MHVFKCCSGRSYFQRSSTLGNNNKTGRGRKLSEMMDAFVVLIVIECGLTTNCVQHCSFLCFNLHKWIGLSHREGCSTLLENRRGKGTSQRGSWPSSLRLASPLLSLSLPEKTQNLWEAMNLPLCLNPHCLQVSDGKAGVWRGNGLAKTLWRK